MGWESPRGGISRKPVRHLTWKLDSLTSWEIKPYCFLNPVPKSGKKQCFKDPDLVIYTFPQNISIQAESTVVKEKGSITMECDIGAIAPIQHVTVRWYDGESIIHQEKGGLSPSKIPIDLVSRYIFDGLSSRGRKFVNLTCEALLDLTPEGPRLNVFSPEFSLLVEYDIELTCPSTYTAIEYVPHNLSCSVKNGSPEALITWFKDGDEVELPETLSRYDAGQYVVVATLFSSTVNTTVELDVVYPPSEIEELVDIKAERGSEVFLKCSARGNPRPEYSWEIPTWINVTQVNEDGVSRLLISDAALHHTGIYTCSARNDRGTAFQQISITLIGTTPLAASGSAALSPDPLYDPASTLIPTGGGERHDCPIRLNPETLVLQYTGESQNVTCSTTGPKGTVVTWEDMFSLRPNEVTWTPDTHMDWDPAPRCTAVLPDGYFCNKPLNFTLYKTPDSVTVRSVNNATFLEGEQCQLHCDIINVAPAQSLLVRWYHGNQTIKPSIREPLQLTDCPHDTNTLCDPSDTRTPVNVTASASFRFNRSHHEADLNCEAILELGPAGPRPAPAVISRAVSFDIYYKPVINTTKLPKVIPLFRGYPEELVCEADGQPPPTIYWSNFAQKTDWELGGNITVFQAGRYICMAVNRVASVVYEVEVVPKEDYLPLIAGFVATTVVVISAIFVFIYSIYYKNTKMRRYSLKNPKLGGPNANVAHNGWDLQFPMTKLS
ncbi:hemicentin-2-like isoform X2 [Corythoichthys intestinalis]|nr:hemicentin-2-like isoform X2 [Corythoichthys intestinalis]